MNKTTIEQVSEFHRVFNHEIALGVGEETLETRQLRIKLLFEELGELAEASDCLGTWNELTTNHTDYQVEDGNNVDHIAELDALCDLQVVLDGKFLTSGHWQHKDKAFAEVHRSNMSKAMKHDSSPNDISREQDHLHNLFKTNKAKEPISVTEKGFTVFKREDGKILKGPDFSKPDLKQFIK